MATTLLDNLNGGAAGSAVAGTTPATGGTWEIHPSFNQTGPVFTDQGRVRPGVAGNTAAAQSLIMSGQTMAADGMVNGVFAPLANVGAFDQLFLAGRINPANATCVVGGVRNQAFYIGQYTNSTNVTLIKTLQVDNLANFRSVGDRVRLEYNGEWVGLFVNDKLVLEGVTTVTAAGRSGFMMQTNTAISADPAVNYANGLQLDSIEAHDLAAQNVAVGDASLFWSDYAWDAGSGYVETSHIGAYMKHRTNHTEVWLVPDLSMFTVAGKTNVTYRWSWDDGIWQQATLCRGQTRLPIHPPSGGGFHDLRLSVTGLGGVDYWTANGIDRAKILGLAEAGGTAVSAPFVFADTLLVYGDSMASGLYAATGQAVWTNGGYTANGAQDSDRSYPVILASAMGCEVGVIGNEGQGFVQTGKYVVPNLVNAWNLHRTGRPRSFAKVPKAVIVCEGVNDSAASDSTITTQVTNLITAMRGAGGIGATTPLLFVASPAGQKASAVQAGVAAAGDAFTRFADVSSLFLKVVGTVPNTALPSLYFADLVHLTTFGAAIFAARIAMALARFPAPNAVSAGSRYGAFGSDQVGTASAGGSGPVVSVKRSGTKMNYTQPSGGLTALALDATTPKKLFASRENGNGGWQFANNTGGVVYTLELPVGTAAPDGAAVRAAGRKWADGDLAEGASTRADVYAVMSAGAGSIYPQQLSRLVG